MGISCKPMGKMQSMFQKIDNEKLKEQKILNHKKSDKKASKETKES